jgi:site-specific DNA-methyltransferase (adenine-specific)
MIQLNTIKPNPDNPRVIKDDKFDKMCRSIKEFPKMMELRPIIIDASRVILGGNMRLRALQHLGYNEIPDGWVRSADDLTDDERKRFIIADNVGYGEWDWEALANEWDAAQLTEWGLDVPDGFGDPEQEAQEDNYQIPDDIETDIVIGDLFQIGQHRLLCGDSTDSDQVARLMNGEKADMVLTDPPYNVDYSGGTGMKIQNDNMGNIQFLQFLTNSFKSGAEVTKPGGAWYIWHIDSENINTRMAFENIGGYFSECLVWVKNSLVLGRLDYHKKHETCLYGWKPGAAHYFTDSRKNTTVIEDKIDPKKLKKEELLKIVTDMLSDKIATTVLREDKPFRSDLHPTMKPILLLAPLISNSSKKTEVVLDIFLGSGSTMVAAHQLNRKCYGMELDPKYCQVIIDRMRNLDPDIQIKKVTT